MVKNPSADAGATKKVGSFPGPGKSPGVGNQPTPVFLPIKFYGQKSLAGGSLQGVGMTEHAH